MGPRRWRLRADVGRWFPLDVDLVEGQRVPTMRRPRADVGCRFPLDVELAEVPRRRLRADVGRRFLLDVDLGCRFLLYGGEQAPLVDLDRLPGLRHAMPD